MPTNHSTSSLLHFTSNRFYISLDDGQGSQDDEQSRSEPSGKELLPSTQMLTEDP